MANIKSSAIQIYSLEQLSGGSSSIHRLHGFAKMLSTAVFIIAVVSFDRYSPGRLIPFVFYPTVIAAVSGTPWRLLLRRVSIALPFVALAGVSNVIFDTGTAFTLGGVAVSFGVVSLAAVLLRTFLCVAALMLLVAVTPFQDLSDQLRWLHLPEIFISMFEMTYRYIGTLMEEASTMFTSYMLRSPNRRGLQMKHMGSFAGQLLIRTYDRAERVYSAMKCRGFAMRVHYKNMQPFSMRDWLFLAVSCAPVIFLRVVDVSALWGSLF